MDHENNKEVLLEETSPQKQTEEQTNDKNGQKRIRLHIDERNLKTVYANGFRTSATPEEVVLDFGLNLVQLPGQKAGERKIVFQVNERIIMNYYSAKRLTINLSQIIRQHEQQFGDIQLDVAKRHSGQR